MSVMVGFRNNDEPQNPRSRPSTVANSDVGARTRSRTTIPSSAWAGPIEKTTTEALMYNLEVFRDWRGDYCWRLISANGHVVATSVDRFTTSEMAKRAAHEAAAMFANLHAETHAHAA